jgi:hypothetical protein
VLKRRARKGDEEVKAGISTSKRNWGRGRGKIIEGVCTLPSELSQIIALDLS